MQFVAWLERHRFMKTMEAIRLYSPESSRALSSRALEVLPLTANSGFHPEPIDRDC
jgi:hypothetical protein